MTPTIESMPLTATDRCDRCGAQAYVRTVLSTGSELLFCSHHWRDNEDRLREIAAIHPGRDRPASTRFRPYGHRRRALSRSQPLRAASPPAYDTKAPSRLGRGLRNAAAALF